MPPPGDVGPDDMLKESEISEVNINNNCGHCKRTVKEKVLCKKCKLIFHPGCMIAANKLQNRVCTHDSDERHDMVEKLMSEIKLLKKIIQEQEEKYDLLKENNKLLEENSKLLRENNILLQDKLKGTTVKTYSVATAAINNEMAPQNQERRKNVVNISNKTKPQHQAIEQSVVASTSKAEIQTKPTQYQQVNREVNKDTIKDEDLKLTQEETWQFPNRKRQANYRRKKQPLFYGTSDENEIRGIPRKIWFFVSRLNPEMTEQDLKNTLQKKCPNTEIVIEKQKLFHEFQSAFKVGISVEYEENAKLANFWPKDSRVDKFNFFLHRKKTIQIG